MTLNIILGTADADTLVGTTAADSVFADAGDDSVTGGDGDDILRGEAGKDTLIGGYGTDRIHGGGGADLIDASHGDDVVYAGAGNDWIRAGDLYSTEYDRVWAGSGDDFIMFWPLNSGEAHGGDGDDTLQIYWRLLSSNDDLHVSISGADQGATLGTLNIAIDSIERLYVYAGNGDDTIIGGALDDMIIADEGANTVQALAGDDTVAYLIGMTNNLDGGDGQDTLRLTQQGGGKLVFKVGDEGVDDGHGSIITGFERYEVAGYYDDDSAWLGAGDDIFRGHLGGDVAYGGGGDDLLLGERGNDRAFGEDGADTLAGGPGHDTLVGGAGNDILTGGRDQDVLTGDEGADRFRFLTVDIEADVVTDMTPGVDRLMFAASLTGNVLTRGKVDSAHFALDGALGAQGQFVYDTLTAPGTGQLYWDANGAETGGATLLAQFTGTPTLSADDLFII